MERHNQVASIVYRHIVYRHIYRLEAPRVKMKDTSNGGWESLIKWWLLTNQTLWWSHFCGGVGVPQASGRGPSLVRGSNTKQPRWGKTCECVLCVIADLSSINKEDIALRLFHSKLFPAAVFKHASLHCSLKTMGQCFLFTHTALPGNSKNV